MSQFTVFENKNPSTKKTYPYLVEIQSNLFDEIRTTVVIPLCKASKMVDAIIAKLCPVVKIKGQKYVALTPHWLASTVTTSANYQANRISK